MAYTAVPEVNTNDQWSASDHNTYIRDNLAYLKAAADAAASAAPPKARATATTDFNSTTTLSNICFETESFDTDTMVDIAGAPTRLTFTTAGLYLVTLWVTFASGTAGSYRHAGIYLSGSSQIGAITVPASDGAVVPVTCQALYQMSAAAYVTAKVQSGETEVVTSAVIAAVKVSD